MKDSSLLRFRYKTHFSFVFCKKTNKNITLLGKLITTPIQTAEIVKNSGSKSDKKNSQI